MSDAQNKQLATVAGDPLRPAAESILPADENPYAAPRTPSPAEVRLYSVGSMVLATFFGSTAAGLLLLALNYRRLGWHVAARLWIAISFAMLVASSLSETAEYEYLTLGLLWVTEMIAVGLIAYHLQGPVIQQHRRAMGQMKSPWKALVVGLLVLVVTGVGALAFMYVLDIPL